MVCLGIKIIYFQSNHSKNVSIQFKELNFIKDFLYLLLDFFEFQKNTIQPNI